jgi:uncharacterized membrane protein YfcA
MKIDKNKFKITTNKDTIFAEFNTMQSNENTPKLAIIWLIIAGLFIGFVNGFWGGGGGMICVPILINLLKLPEKKGHATTILIMLPLCIASFVVYLIKGSFDFGLAINIGSGFLVGGIIGAVLLKKINNTALKFIFSIIIIMGGVKLIL